MPPCKPGIFGPGTDTRGAFGDVTNPVILTVDNWNDTGSGSLRAALEDSRAAVILPRVGGYIDLNSTISISNPFKTIAGSVGPAPGLYVRKYGFEVSTHDIYSSHFTIWNGDFGQAQNTCCTINFDVNAWNIVYANMTFGLAIDENFSFDKYNPSVPMNSTAFRCLSHDSLDDPASFPGKGGHGYLFQPQSHFVAIIQCMTANNRERNPYFQGDVYCIVLNNIIYNWYSVWGIFCNNFDINGNPGGALWKCSAVGNLFKPGPLSGTDGTNGFAADMFNMSAGAGNTAGNKMYRADNILENPLGVIVNPLVNSYSYNPLVATDSLAVPLTGLGILPSGSVKSTVIPVVGSRPAYRDSLTTQVIGNFTNATSPFRYPKSQSDVGGFPVLSQTGPISLSVPSNPFTYAGNGYTNIENWIFANDAFVEGQVLASSFGRALFGGIGR